MKPEIKLTDIVAKEIEKYRQDLIKKFRKEKRGRFRTDTMFSKIFKLRVEINNIPRSPMLEDH